MSELEIAMLEKLTGSRTPQFQSNGKKLTETVPLIV
jgi:hypothetical protein